MDIFKYILKNILYFLIFYLVVLAVLFVVKYCLDWSNYVIPSPLQVYNALLTTLKAYSFHTWQTFKIVLAGHMLSIAMAFSVGFLVVLFRRVGPFIKSSAYILESLPIVATAPIFIILFGPNLITKFIITCIICYFPILLPIIGSLNKPIPDIEHYFKNCKRLDKLTLIKIRLSENLKTILTTITGSSVLAFVGAIVAEFLAFTEGIGFIIRTSLDSNNLDSILVILIYIGLASWGYYLILELLKSYILSYILRIKG